MLGFGEPCQLQLKDTPAVLEVGTQPRRVLEVGAATRPRARDASKAVVGEHVDGRECVREEQCAHYFCRLGRVASGARGEAARGYEDGHICETLPRIVAAARMLVEGKALTQGCSEAAKELARGIELAIRIVARTCVRHGDYG